MKTAEQKEDLRHAALEYLVAVHPARVTPGQIGRAVRKLTADPFEETDLEGALEFLRGQKLALVDFDGLGSTQYWCASSEGCLYYERNLK